MDYNKFTARELNDMSRIFAGIRTEIKTNSDLFRISYDDEATIHIEHMDFTTDFYCIISNPKFDNSNNYIYYGIEQKPQNDTDNSSANSRYPSKDNRILEALKRWIGLVRNIHNVKQKIHPNSNILGHYQKQLFESFSFLEDENDDIPLPRKTQEELSDFLILLIEQFEKDDDIDDEIVEELKSLNKMIPQLTQFQIKNYITHTFAKMMYKSIGLINRITKVATDAGIGQLFIEGIKSL